MVCWWQLDCAHMASAATPKPFVELVASMQARVCRHAPRVAYIEWSMRYVQACDAEGFEPHDAVESVREDIAAALELHERAREEKPKQWRRDTRNVRRDPTERVRPTSAAPSFRP